MAIVSAVISAGAVWYARWSARSAERSAIASEATAALETQRRQTELTPRFRVTCKRPATARAIVHLHVALAGPPELRELDLLAVDIRDDLPGRSNGTRAGGATPAQVVEQVWGPNRFVPGSAPVGSNPAFRKDGDAIGRTTTTCGMHLGEEQVFVLEPTYPPPSRSEWAPEDWREQRGTVIRLRLHCHREEWDWWTLAGEIDTADLPSTVDIP